MHALSKSVGDVPASWCGDFSAWVTRLPPHAWRMQPATKARWPAAHWPPLHKRAACGCAGTGALRGHGIACRQHLVVAPCVAPCSAFGRWQRRRAGRSLQRRRGGAAQSPAT